jgi:metal-responsive CopG/Arc/MetJ family transcriptional regulator
MTKDNRQIWAPEDFCRTVDMIRAKKGYRNRSEYLKDLSKQLREVESKEKGDKFFDFKW